jgi:hypothetical protein
MRNILQETHLKVTNFKARPWGRLIAGFLQRGPGSRPGQFMRHLRWTRKHCGRFLSESFSFSLSLSLNRYSILTRFSSGRWKMGLLPAHFHIRIVVTTRNLNKNNVAILTHHFHCHDSCSDLQHFQCLHE